ncbi:hypothetical protein C2S51_030947 [Perilla frutescens var. frutescens]|nr:hypothetical protein C2S51_030947 [Perilla frutescens var. frutescens]
MWNPHEVGAALSVHGQNLMPDQYEFIRTILDTVRKEAESRAEDSSIWFAGWWKRLERVGH